MKVQQVDNCRFSTWYPRFCNSTIKSRIITLKPEFIEYLHADGLYLEEDHAPKYADVDSDYSDTEEWAAREEDKDEVVEHNTKINPHHQCPTFPELEGQIATIINELGSVFPKLNWTSPRDAVWITSTSTLECRSASDIFMLLKGSDYIIHDLENAYGECEDAGDQKAPTSYELVLRKWSKLQPSMEFRCFVKDNELIAITQRYPTTYFPFLSAKKEEISGRIEEFYEEKIEGKFPDSDYVFDVYVEARDICLIDFNPFGGASTETGLFDWEELAAGVLNGELPEIRVVETDAGIQPSPMAYARVPRDIVDLSTGADIDKFVDLCRMNGMAGIAKEPDSESDEENGVKLKQ